MFAQEMKWEMKLNGDKTAIPDLRSLKKGDAAN